VTAGFISPLFILGLASPQPYFAVNGLRMPGGVVANWQRQVKRTNTDGTVEWQSWAIHTWEMTWLDMASFLVLQGVQGQVLSSLATTDIDNRNSLGFYTAAEVISAVNTRQTGLRAGGVRIEFRVGVS
jgi:hypothetical protein